MTHIDDLSGHGEFQPVGWLSKKPYQHGWVPWRYRRRLRELLREPWEQRRAMGFHTCELCRVYPNGVTTYIPGDGCNYLIPGMISHYINVHFYKPPQAFLDAVIVCPDMSSEAYFDALIANSSQDWSWEFLGNWPCPYCGAQKRRPYAKQCPSCAMDWHGEPYNARERRLAKESAAAPTEGSISGACDSDELEKGSQMLCPSCGGKMRTQSVDSKVSLERCDDCGCVFVDRDHVSVFKDMLGIGQHARLDGEIDEFDCPACGTRVEAVYAEIYSPFWYTECASCSGMIFDSGLVGRRSFFGVKRK